VIDLHTHLLPAVDDGSPSLENSVRVLEQMVREGVTAVACTPHLEASQAALAPVAEYAARLEALRAAAPPQVQLHAGFEVMLDDPRADLARPGLTLGGSRALLVELPRRPLSPAATDELLRVRASGVVPVIAHPERYQGISIDTLHVWRDMGVVVQGDGLLLLSRSSRGAFSRLMLAEGVCDVIASDNHGDRRSLGTVRLWLAEVGGERQARILLHDNPAHLLADELLKPVPPLRERRSLLRRFLDLFPQPASTPPRPTA
jgi:protein-tyrosine phosphatase